MPSCAFILLSIWSGLFIGKPGEVDESLRAIEGIWKCSEVTETTGTDIVKKVAEPDTYFIVGGNKCIMISSDIVAFIGTPDFRKDNNSIKADFRISGGIMHKQNIKLVLSRIVLNKDSMVFSTFKTGFDKVRPESNRDMQYPTRNLFFTRVEK